MLCAINVMGYSQYTRHKLMFNVPSVTIFDVALYDGTGYSGNFTSNSTYPGNYSSNYAGTTGDIMFNATTPTQLNVNAFATAGTAGQTGDASCILQYTNKGTTTIAPLVLNITSQNCEGSACNGLVGDKIVCGGGTITVQAATTYAGDYVQLTNASSFQATASLASGALQKVCLQANFSSVAGGTTCYIDLLSAG